MPWSSRLLRDARVFARAAADGTLATDGEGRVDILYKKAGKVYRAAARNLAPDPAAETWTDEEASPGEARAGEAPSAPQARGASRGNRGAAPAREPAASRTGPSHATTAQADAYLIWADGACTGNPGPAGLGVVIIDGATREERSEYLGEGTNNIAELTAIVRALEHAPADRTVVLHSDSAYALGFLSKGKSWKPKANQELVGRMRELARRFRDLRLVKVAGHAGVVENERADALAREAVSTRGSRRTRSHGGVLERPAPTPAAEPPEARRPPPRKLGPSF